jgi:transcriptional regulator with XRE-family HTH domain
MAAARPGDLGRRVAHRRGELGLSREEVARRAGMSPGYLDYLEHSPSVTLPRGSLIRLADALETTLGVLRGGAVDRAPGPGRAGPHPKLDELTHEECEAHLTGGGVGRLVFVTAGVPLALPVNFRYLDGDIVFRTRAGGALAAALGTIVSFEVDRIDEAMSEGWSVLASGHAHLVDNPDELEQIAALGIEPWPGGRRETIVRVETAQLSGRRIRQTG